MSIETPKEPREVFINKLRDELNQLLSDGRISNAQREDKMAAAEKIEEGFSADPEHDAVLFSRVGLESTTEEELVGILDKRRLQK